MTSLKFTLPVSEVHERLIYQVYEGDKIINTETIQGHSFTTLGKNRLAEMIRGTSNPAGVKLDMYRVLVDASTWFSSAATVVSFDQAAGMITAETQEFQSAGEYKRIQGMATYDLPDVNSYYHYVTTSVTISAGQSVKFFVEYTFTGLGSEGGTPPGLTEVNGNNVCAACLMDSSMWDSDAPNRIGWVVLETSNGTKFSSELTGKMGIVANVVTISGVQFTLGDGFSTHYIRVYNSSTNPILFHEWSYDGAGDSQGPFSINNDTGSPITIQTDFEFTFDG